MVSKGSLTIHGHRTRRVPNSFYRQKVDSDALCILFGGWHYTTDMPLFYYTRRIFTGLGYDVLAVDFQYADSRRYAQLPDRKRQEWFLEEVRAAFAAVSRKKYRRVVLGAKGIGALALGHLLIEGLVAPETSLIWLSPPLDAESIRETLISCTHPSLVVIGKADPRYSTSLARKLSANKNLTVKSVRDADEDLELAGNVVGSIKLLSTYLDTLRKFLGIAPDRKTGRSATKTSGGTTRKSGGQTAGRSGSRATGKPGSRKQGQSGSRATGKSGGRTASQTGGQGPRRSTGRSTKK